MLLPDRCAACGSVGPSPCPSCVLRLRLAPRLEPLPPLVSLAALLAYEGGGRSLVTALKYRGARTSLAWLADGLSRLVVSSGADLDALTWAPTSGPRRRARGFDQARLLAQAVGRRTGLPVHDVLRRLPGPPQTGRSRQDRMTGPRFAAFRPVSGRSYLIVDDVVTTGATLAAAARALQAAGALRLAGLAAAATPSPDHDDRVSAVPAQPAGGVGGIAPHRSPDPAPPVGRQIERRREAARFELARTEQSE